MVVSFKPYSLALYELAKDKDQVPYYMVQLKKLSDIWKENEDFLKALRHPKITRREKKEWISQLFESELDPLLYRYLLVMVEHDQIGYIPEIYEAFIEVYKEDQNIESVLIESACPLSEDQIRQIKTVIEKKLKKNIEVRTNVVPELIAGVRVRTKDFVLDNSMLSRISNLKEKLENAY